MNQGDYERLSKIAPTIAQSGEYVDFGMPWQEQTMPSARALGARSRAQVVADVEEKFAQVREDHPAFEGKSAILAYGGPDGYGAYTSGTPAAASSPTWGSSCPRRSTTGRRGFFTEFSQERFRLADQDLVVMYGPRRTRSSHPVVGRLDAVREDRMVYLDLADQFAGALGFSSPLSLDWLLERRSRARAAVDGDPGTPVEQPE